MPLSEGDATDISRQIIIALTGGRWVSPPVQMIDEYPIPESGRVILSGRPVVSVESVVTTSPAFSGAVLPMADGAAPTPGFYRVTNGFVLELGRRVSGSFGASYGWWTRRYDSLSALQISRVEIKYTYGVGVLPPLVQRAVDVFAAEVLAADGGSKDARIPERVTTVTRQGVSWTMIDPLQFLDKGKTGIYEVDLAIRAANPSGAKRRVRVFTATSSAPAVRRLP